MREPAIKSAILMFFGAIIGIATSLATNVIQATGYTMPVLVALISAAILTPIAAWLLGYKVGLTPEILMIYIVIAGILTVMAVIGVNINLSPFQELLPR